MTFNEKIISNLKIRKELDREDRSLNDLENRETNFDAFLRD